MFAYSAKGTRPESVYDVEDEELLPVMREFLDARRQAAVELTAAG
jgi:hypothetical protein